MSVVWALFIFYLLQFEILKPEQAFRTLEEGLIVCSKTYWSGQMSQMSQMSVVYASRSDSSVLRREH